MDLDHDLNFAGGEEDDDDTDMKRESGGGECLSVDDQNFILGLEPHP